MWPIVFQIIYGQLVKNRQVIVVLRNQMNQNFQHHDGHSVSAPRTCRSSVPCLPNCNCKAVLQAVNFLYEGQGNHWSVLQWTAVGHTKPALCYAALEIKEELKAISGMKEYSNWIEEKNWKKNHMNIMQRLFKEICICICKNTSASLHSYTIPRLIQIFDRWFSV